jgi:hypothetical protein
VRQRRIAGRPPARGLALIGVLAVVTMLTLTAFVSQIGAITSHSNFARDVQARLALNIARQALIAAAADNRNRPGGLPCPDRDGDGEAELTCDRPEHRLGLLPWQTLKIGDLRDASGERLWYALAYRYRNDPDAIINSATVGDLAIPSRRLSDLAAVVIAPGAAMRDQVRGERSVRNSAAYVETTLNVTTGALVEAAESNDTLEPLSAAEVWASVDNVVGARIAREIGPLIESEYIAQWKRLPYAAPFTDPASVIPIASNLVAASEGALPATHEPLFVVWDRPQVAASQVSGSGRLDSADCTASLPTEIRCIVRYSGTVRLRIEAVALNVGHALVSLPTTSDADFGPAGLARKSITTEPLRADASARIVAQADLPPLASSMRINLRAPAYIRALTDRHIPVASAGSWFARNEWFRFTYLAVASDQLPGGRARGCGGPASCLSLHVDGRNQESLGVVVFTGRANAFVPNPASAPLITRYLEGENASIGDGTFERRSGRVASNDSGFALCVGPTHRCGGG